MSNSDLQIPEEILKNYILDLKSKLNDKGQRIYSNQRIIELVSEFERAFRKKNLTFVKN